MNKNLLSLLAGMLALAMVFAGCTASKQSLDRYDTSMYYIHQEGGQYWLTLKNSVEELNNSSINASTGYLFPRFTSVAEMRQGIISGSYLEDRDAKLYMTALTAVCPKNEDGSLQIVNLDELCDFNKPQDMDISLIEWQGDNYWASLKGETTYAYIHYVETEAKYPGYLGEYKDFLTDPLITIDRQEEDENRGAIVYYVHNDWAEFKYICYEISVGAKHVYVQEVYALARSGAHGPYRITLWGKEDVGCFCVVMYDLTERPSVEWLSQFGVREYVETEVA